MRRRGLDFQQGQVGPSRPPEGARVPGLFTAEQVAQIAQIVAIATHQQSQPTPPLLIEPKHMYEFITPVPKDYCLIPSNNAIKLVD